MHKLKLFITVYKDHSRDKVKVVIIDRLFKFQVQISTQSKFQGKQVSGLSIPAGR